MMTQDEMFTIFRHAARISREAGHPISDLHAVVLAQMIEYARKSPHGEELTLGISLSDMADEFGWARATMTEAVDTLTAAGLITRKVKKEGDVRHTGGMTTTINGEVLC